MIKHLKRKFIFLTAISLFVLLLIVVSGINITNYSSSIAESDEILTLLSRNKGHFPMNNGELGTMEKPEKLPPKLSPELPYEIRYFSVLFGKDSEVLHVETSRIAAVDPASAIKYAKTILNSGDHHGFLNHFRFMRSTDDGFIRVVFLDCSRQLNTLNGFLLTSFIFALLCFAIVLIAVIFLAEKIVHPISESYEKQKRFITDAGHEIRTPLTIIRANVDLLEMEIGENECLCEICTQTNRLALLTEDLVSLSRMEEERSYEMIEFPLSDLVYESAIGFRALAETQKKTIELNIEPMISFKGNSQAISQLISILMDNALKYSNDNGTIKVSLSKASKNIYLSVSNTTDITINKADLERIFDRFYRTDSSRNSQKGGYGIGLSMAKAIVVSHGGQISALTDDGTSFKITAVF